MGLGHHSPLAVLETVDDPDLPQRLGPVELLRHDPSDQLPQLGVPARRRQGGVPDVVVDVEVGVVDPDRAPDVERHLQHDLAVARDQGELSGHHGHELLEGRLGALEDGDGADVQLIDAVLEVEERGIERAQPIAGHGSRP
jgi:hypothetical protein